MVKTVIYSDTDSQMIIDESLKDAVDLEVKGIIQKICEHIKLSTYLAGPIGVIPIKGSEEWRVMLSKELENLGIDSFNPMAVYGGDNPEARRILQEKYIGGDLEGVRDIVSNQIIEIDLDALIKSSFITVYIPKRVLGLDLTKLKRMKTSEEIEKYIESLIYEICGTYGEITLARYFKKPVYIITDRSLAPCKLPAWSVGCSTWIFTTKGQYLRFVKATYVDGNV